MGRQMLETKADDKQEIASSYSVISYPGTSLPDTYQNLIFSKWLRSLRYGNDYYKLIDQDAYFIAYHAYISKLLAQPDAIVRLAVLTDDPDVVLGFSVTRGTTLDYVHVHKDFRKQGIGTTLVPKDIHSITHLTKIGMAIWNAKLAHAKFNPFI